MAALTHSVDPTLAALDALHEQAFSGDFPRPYLGASQIGDPCSRKIWYGFRWALPRSFSAKSYRAIQDGHRGESVMVEWLRQLPDIQLWTRDPENEQNQIGFVDLAGHFRGHVDGILQGLYQAPKTPHVWEHKVCNETKFNKLVKLIQTKGEKAALAEWDDVYFAQAQVYMREMQLTRHYLTVTTPGNRAIISCRTEYQPKVAQTLIKKAAVIITAERPLLKLSENASWYQCKFCDYHGLCHSEAIPAVNCRTCAHSTARLNADQPWTCELQQPAIDGDQAGCNHHAFHPDLLANHAEAIGANPKTGVIKFRRKDGTEFENGKGAVSSQSLWEQAQKTATGIPATEQNQAIEEDVLVSLACEMVIEPAELLSGDLHEPDFERMASAVYRLSNIWEGDEPRKQRLAALLEQIDGAWMQLAGQVTMRGTAA